MQYGVGAGTPAKSRFVRIIPMNLLAARCIDVSISTIEQCFGSRDPGRCWRVLLVHDGLQGFDGLRREVWRRFSNFRHNVRSQRNVNTAE
jgi:hypothetical protein